MQNEKKKVRFFDVFVFTFLFFYFGYDLVVSLMSLETKPLKSGCCETIGFHESFWHFLITMSFKSLFFLCSVVYFTWLIHYLLKKR